MKTNTVKNKFYDVDQKTIDKAELLINPELNPNMDLDDIKAAIDLLFPKNTQYNPDTILKDIQSRLESASIDIEKEFDDKSGSGAIAYVYKVFHKNFRMYINPLLEKESVPYLQAHEYGHIYFNHTNFRNIYMTQFEKIVNDNWETIVKYLDEKDIEVVSKEDVIKFLYNKLFNIAQDMEINSKFFDNDWDIASHTIRRATIISYLENPNTIQEALKELNLKVLRGDTDLKFCHPEQHGWPKGLDWLNYMMFLCQNLEEFLKFETGQSGQSGQGQSTGLQQKSQEGEADGSGENSDDNDGKESDSDSDSGKKDGKGSGNKSGKKITKEDIESYNENASKAEEEANRKAEEARAKAKQKEASKKQLSEADFEMDPSSDKGVDGSCLYETSIEHCDSVKSFNKLIEKLALSKKNRKMHSDVFYHSNRGRTMGNGGVLTPRRHYTEKNCKDSIQILVDTSGSMPAGVVSRIIKSIIENNSFNKKTSHIVQWDTSLCADNTLEEDVKLYSGGGTNIAPGINYISRYIKTRKDKLFIVSDFEDDLDRWVHIGKKTKCEKIAIQWYGRDIDRDFEQVKDFTKQFKVYTVKLD